MTLIVSAIVGCCIEGIENPAIFSFYFKPWIKNHISAIAKEVYRHLSALGQDWIQQ
jgi:hypothetical protein